MNISRIKKFCCALFILIALVNKTDSLIALQADESEEVTLPIIMYHNLSKKTSGTYVITPEEFEKDLQYLMNNGYHTIKVSDLINFVYNNEPLPEKPIILTFDDGYYNNYVYAVPLLEKYDMNAVISIIGIDTDKWSENSYEDLKYGHVTWTQISEMIKTGHVDIANHTYDMHLIKNGRKGCGRKSGEDLESYYQVLKKDMERLQISLKENIDYVSECFTYPFGYVSPESVKMLKDLGFKSAFSCPGGPNKINPKQPDCLYDLRRFNRTMELPLKKILDTDIY